MPGHIFHTATLYIRDDGNHPFDAAFRIKEPANLDPDDFTYNPIRPGVMVSSKDLLTTSGVAVKAVQGETFQNPMGLDGVALVGIRDPAEMKIGDVVTMDKPRVAVTSPGRRH